MCTTAKGCAHTLVFQNNRLGKWSPDARNARSGASLLVRDYHNTNPNGAS